MPQRNTPQYQQAEQAQPYLGEYSRLAEQFLKKRNVPIYSVGQGLAEAGSDIAEAYFLKKAAEKEQQKSVADNRALATAFGIAGDTGLTKAGIAQMGGQGQSLEQQAFSPNANESDRYRAAINALAGNNPQMAVTGAPAIMQMAKAAEPPPRMQDVPLAGGAIGQRNPLTNELSVPFTPPAPRESEPLVEVADPKDPTRGVMVPRSQAAGRATVQTVRDRMPRVKTYYDESGNPITLDSNDPADQERIKGEGLSDKAPTESERAAKGYLDRMVAAESEVDKIDPKILANFYDATARKMPLGNYLVSDNYRQALQKIKDWTRAKLRKESGAVIGDEEALEEFKTYWGEPGDDPGTLAGKKGSRLEARRQLATQAGTLGRSVLRDIQGSKAEAGGVPDGIDPNVWKHMTPEERALWQS